MNIDEVRRAYDVVAEQYQRRFTDELAAKPYDRDWLDAFAAANPAPERIVEVGCGDGHVAAYLAERGALLDGVDLSPAMVALAARTYPALRFVVGDMRALPLASASIDAVVSFYSIVNLTAADCVDAFAEFARVLRPRGRATLAFHAGDERRRVERWWGSEASLDFHLHPAERVCAQLRAAGFGVLCCEVRRPYDESIEAQTQRAYVLAQRPRSR